MLDDVPCLSGTLFPNWVRCLMHPPTLTLITILISVQLLLTFYYFTQTLICDTLTSFTSKSNSIILVKSVSFCILTSFVRADDLQCHDISGNNQKGDI